MEVKRTPRPITDTIENCVTFIGSKYKGNEYEMILNAAPKSLIFIESRDVLELFANVGMDSDVELLYYPDAKAAFFKFVSARCDKPNDPPVIGNGCDIHPSVVIYPNVVIGDGVIIKANSVIGGDGFGYYNGMKLPNFGRVVIFDNVHIGSCTCIDRGTLGDTIIESGVHIDNLVHIAHNVHLMEGSTVIANSMVAGSTVIGKNAWIAPSASIRNGISIGANSIVGLGAVVSSRVGDDAIVLGNPAMDINEFKAMRSKLKSL